ncbi:MAG: flagellar basal body-associated protein FliL [Lachnospirales bacterium]
MEKNKLMMIIIIVLLVVLLVTIVGVSLVGLKYLTAAKDEETTKVSEEVKELTPSEITTIDIENPISVNLRQGEDGEDHAVRVEVSIGIDNTQEEKSTEFLTMLESKTVIIKDVIISVLSSKTYEDMTRADANDIIKDEILQALRKEFNSDLIAKVYIGNMFTQ